MKAALRSILVACFAFQAAVLSARPVDLSAPPGAFGPATDEGHALHWVEFTEIDFGGGLSLPLRMSFLSGRDGASLDFGAEGWRSPLFTSRLKARGKESWSVLLPCGKVMTMVPQAHDPRIWGTPDGEWIAKAKGGNTLVAREDGWEMEFDRRGLLIRLRTDAGRNVLWSRNAEGGLIAVSELVNGRPAPSAFTVERDPATGLIAAMTARTAHGAKAWKLAFDAERRLQSIAFPDGTAVRSAYDTTTEGHPRITITGRDLLKTVLAWHKVNLTLVSDGVWTYNIVPLPGTGPIMNRTGPHGETESFQDDHQASRGIFTAADGTTTIRHKVKSGGPAKGKIERITRTTGFQPVTPAGVPPAPKEATLYTATYDSRGMVIEETDALGRKTKHSYVLHGASAHSGILRHQTTDPLGHRTTQEFDRAGNLIAITNPLGNIIRHEYDAQNRRTRTVGPDGSVMEALTYTAAGQIASRTDPAGAATRYSYDAEGNRISVTDALGHVTKDAFDARGHRVSTTDPLGRVWKSEFDAGGRVIRELDPTGAETARHSYDDQGRRIATTDAAGHTVKTSYDALGRITSREDQLGRITKYAYDVKKGSTGCIACSSSALPTTVTLPSGRQIHRVYDADQRLVEESQTGPAVQVARPTPERGATKVIPPLSTRHTYDLGGNLLSTTDPLGRATTHLYDAANRRIKTIHPDRTEKSFAYDAAGRMVAETDELGHTAKREYDGYGHLVSLTDPAGNTTRHHYDTEVISPVPAGALVTTAAIHRPSAIVSPSGIRTDFIHDALGRRIAQIRGAKSRAVALAAHSAGVVSADSALALTRHEFDAVGNEVKSTDPAGRVTTHVYDVRNRRIATVDAIGRRWMFSYAATSGSSGPPPCCGSPPESNAKAAETTFPDGTKEVTVTDAAGMVIEKIDAKGDSTKFAYDPDRRLETLTDARGSITRWRYDERGKLAAKVYPDKTMEIYDHDAAGQLIRKVRPDGTAARYSYDLRGRLLTIQWDGGRAEPSTFAYDATGRMIKAINPSAAIERAYSPAGKLSSETQTITASFEPNQQSEIKNQRPAISNQKPEISHLKSEIQYTHDPDGRLASITYPDKSILLYTYNHRGELSEVTSPQQFNLRENRGLVTRYTRHPDGAIARLEMGNGLVTTKDYDPAGRLIKTTHSKQGRALAPASAELEILESETLRYDDRNRRTARIRADGQADLFAYDPAGQVIAAAYGEARTEGDSPSVAPPQSPNPSDRKSEGGSPSVPPSASAARNTETEKPNKPFTPDQTFEYDAAGNRMKTTDSGQTAEYQANENNQYTQLALSGEVFTPEYDKNGNLLKDPARTYTWDADIHLLSVTTRNTAVPAVGVPGVPPASGNPKASKPTTAKGQESGISHQESKITESFRYDALHRRVARQVTRSSGSAGAPPAAGGTPPPSETTYFIMDGWNVIAEYRGSVGAAVSVPGVPPDQKKEESAATAVGQRPATHSGVTPELRLSAKHLWGEDLSRALQGAGGIGGLLLSVHFAAPSAATPSQISKSNSPSPSSFTAFFFSYDSNGNVILLTDPTAIPSARYRYDAFGQTTLATGAAAELNKFRFSTKPIEMGSGLAYYGYRYYDLELGRWLNRDAIGETGGVNLYALLTNQPTDKIDYLGQISMLPGPAILDSMACVIFEPFGVHVCAVYGVNTRCWDRLSQRYIDFQSCRAVAHLGYALACTWQDVEGTAAMCQALRECYDEFLQ